MTKFPIIGNLPVSAIKPANPVYKTTIDAVTRKLLTEEWAPVRHEFRDRQGLFEIQFRDKSKVLYQHNMLQHRSVLTVGKDSFELSNQDPLFSFFSEILIEFKPDQLMYDNWSYLHAFHKETPAVRHLDPRRQPRWEIVGHQLYEELPIVTKLDSFGWNMKADRPDWKHGYLDQIELVLQFEHPLPEWFYLIPAIFALDANHAVAERAADLMRQYSIGPVDMVAVINKFHAAVLDKVMAGMESAIAIGIKAKETRGLPAGTAPKIKMSAPAEDEFGVFRQLLNLYLRDDRGPEERLPYFHDEMTYKIRDAIDFFSAFSDAFKKRAPYQILAAKLVSEILGISNYYGAHSIYFELETDYLTLKLLARSNRIDPAIFQRINHLMEEKRHLYSRLDLDQLQEMIKKAFSTIGAYQAPAGTEALDLGSFGAHLNNLPEYFKQFDLPALFTTYFTAKTEKEFRSAYTIIITKIHPDVVPKQAATNSYYDLVRLLIEDFPVRRLWFKRAKN